MTDRTTGTTQRPALAHAPAAEAAEAAEQALEHEQSAREAEQSARAVLADTLDARDAAVANSHDADTAQREAEVAVAVAQEVAEAILASDDPLLDPAMHELAAAKSDVSPFGLPGKPLSRRSPFRVAFSASLGVLVAVALAAAVLAARQVLILVLVAAFLAIGLDPAVRWLVRHGLRRGLAVGAVLIAVLLLFGGFIAAAVPPLVAQGTELVQQAPSYAEKIQNKNTTLARLDARYHFVDQLKARVAQGPDLGSRALGGVVGVGKAVFNAMLSTLTVLILTLYFLTNFADIKRMAYRLVPRSRRARFGLLTDEIAARVGGYVLGNLATSVVAGVAATIFLAVAGVPYPVALGLLIALTDLIPLVGASIGAGVVVIVALFDSVTVGLVTAGFFLAYQQFENYVLVPRVMQRTVDVSPVATIVAVLIGAALLGVIGALLAIPVAAALRLVLAEVVFPRQDTA